MTYYIILSIAMIAVCVLDLAKVFDLSRKKYFVLYLFLAPHLPFLWFHFWVTQAKGRSGAGVVSGVTLFVVATIIFQLYTTLRLHVQLLRGEKTSNIRVNIIYAGRNLLNCGMWGLYLLLFWYVMCYFGLPVNPYREVIENNYVLLPSISDTVKSTTLLILEAVYSVIFVWLFLFNGCLRIFFGSRNLVVGKRVIIVFLMWVPIVQLFLAPILASAAKDEYLVALSRENHEAFTDEDDKCKTKYPFVMVHGIGFRDLKYFNYWGRIPQILEQHGAKIYYGHQNAWGTIENNAQAVARVIDRALEENGCNKVNIIAHSKGGLDCRYLISTMGYGDKVASLTTINTPHYGSELITVLNKLPDWLYRFISKQLDKPMLAIGDSKPDCYNSSKQLDPAFCIKFNEENKDVEGVYYQSYMSVMKNFLADTLLSIPYLVMCTQKGRANDGLVNVESAKWGEFRGVLKTTGKRGVSHGDMIDLKREDIRGFDVLKQFYEIVCELKQMGY